MNSKICSVVIPIYNAAPYLAQCLSSIKMQTYKGLQVVLVDDGSTDESIEIAQSFVDADNRFSLYQQPHHGQSVARNKGLQYVTGEYLVFVDADDYLDIDFVERHVAALGNADYVQSGYRRVSVDGDPIEQKLPIHRYQFTSACMRLYRMKFLAKLGIAFPPDMIYEDVIFSLYVWSSKPKIHAMKYIGYNYRYNTHSTTSMPNRMAQHKLFTTIHQMHGIWWLKVYIQLRLILHFILCH